MAKTIVILVSVLISIPALAKSDCYLLLTNRAEPADKSEQEFAETWMQYFGVALDSPLNKKWSSENILQRWRSWRHVTPLQREQALALELMKISPRENPANPVFRLDSAASLTTLSAANQARMLKQIEILFPVSAQAEGDKELLTSASNLASRIKFVYVRPVNPLQFTRAPEGFDAPVASPRELTALDLNPMEGFYSRLVGTSPSAEFVTMASKSSANEGVRVGTLLRRETLVLKNNFAKENGFALPRFASPKDLLDFFDFWDPKASEEVFRANWAGLPSGMRTYEEFRAFLETTSIFSAEGVYSQLAPLRSRLYQYVMTTKDAEEFLRQALRRYILSLASQEPAAVQGLNVNLLNSATTMRFFREKFFPLLHFPDGMAMRIPIGVSSDDYILSRVEDSHVPATQPLLTLRGPVFDPRALDHDAKP
jgi:hypothetical protein